MALQKEINTKYGIIASYWKITSMIMKETRTQYVAEITLSGYVNSDTSKNGEPLEEIKFSWRGEEYPYREPIETNFKTIAYNKIKAPALVLDSETGNNVETNIFADAIDV